MSRMLRMSEADLAKREGVRVEKLVSGKLNKMRNIPTEVDGITFQSRKEAKRYQELKLLEAAGEIYALILQYRMSLDAFDLHIGIYVADFVYFKGNGEWVIEDVKGQRSGTPYQFFKWKAKHVRAQYGVEVKEI